MNLTGRVLEYRQWRPTVTRQYVHYEVLGQPLGRYCFDVLGRLIRGQHLHIVHEFFGLQYNLIVLCYGQ